MAQTPYSVKINQAYAAIDPWKRVVASLAKDVAKDPSKKAKYDNAVKQLAAAQKAFNDLKKAEQAWKQKQTTDKNTSTGKSKQTDLDIALATGDKAKADKIAKEMAGLGVQPVGLDGKPLAGFKPVTSTSSTTSDAVTNKTPVLDANKNGIPDNVESAASTKAAADAAAAKATAAAAAKAAAAKAVADQAVADKELALKTMYVDYLRSTFAGLEDKKQKAEIDALFDKASKEGWSAENFQMALEGTSWWQTTLPSLRSWYLDTHDPRKQSTTVELIRNKVASVSSYLEQLGITPSGIDPVTGKAYDKTGYVSGIAQEAVKNGWNDNQLRDYLATQAGIMFTGGGEIGSSLSKIRDTAYAYGIEITPQYEKIINNSLLDSSDGRDANYYIAEMRRQALDSPNNKAFKEALESGRTLYEATRSYRGQMASLLEVDESNVTWADLMKKTIDNTTGAARTFADFTKEVKNDPLWQQTRNAKETYSSNALDLAKMFGLVG